MARLTTTVSLDAQLHERIVQLKMHVGTTLNFNENTVGLGVMLGLLLDHWEVTPPSVTWLEAQLRLYPKRGRPRRSQQVTFEPRIAMRSVDVKGHELFCRKRDFNAPYQTWFCRHCNMSYSTWDTKIAPATCPRKKGFQTIYEEKIWTKNELLSLGFETDEVEWAAP